jgi:hypothetical protein
MSKKFLLVNGKRLPVLVRGGGYLKVAMNGYLGWTFIWAKDELELTSILVRIGRERP